VRLASRFSTPWRIIVKELSAFGVVGAVNLAVDVGIFNALHFGAGLGPLTSKVISTSISTTLSYFMNRHWSFSHRARTGLGREYTLFFLLNGVALLIGLAVIALVHYGFGLSSPFALNVANLIGIGLGSIFRFWSYKRWVFLSKQRADERSDAHTAAGLP
jgi:putative flippase GtrA